jgi:hypothetical protein
MLSNYLKQNQQILKIRLEQFADSFDGQYVTRKTSHWNVSVQRLFMHI